MLMTTILAKEKILCVAINCWNTILAITALEISHFELFLIWSGESDFILNHVLTGTT